MYVYVISKERYLGSPLTRQTGQSLVASPDVLSEQIPTAPQPAAPIVHCSLPLHFVFLHPLSLSILPPDGEAGDTSVLASISISC